MSSFTLIYYYIPEDGETQTDLNTYGIPKSKDQVTLKDIKNTFPLRGKYTFRFLTKYNKSNIFVDVLSEDENVPFAEKKVIVKANRINWVAPKPPSPKVQVSKTPEAKVKDHFDFEFN